MFLSIVSPSFKPLLVFPCKLAVDHVSYHFSFNLFLVYFRSVIMVSFDLNFNVLHQIFLSCVSLLGKNGASERGLPDVTLPADAAD